MATAAAALLLSPLAQANTSWAHGGNWADGGAGLVNNVIMYPDGITSSTTTTQAAAVADTVACDYKAVGINFVRYPINPATVSGNWAVTQAAINELISQGMTVDICCWYVDPQPQGGNGLIRDMTTWEDMWETVDGVYGNNNSVYYEPINEPSGYSLSGLESVYTTFLGLGLAKSQGHIILGGTGYEDNVTGIGADSSFNNCLLAVHDYSMWDSYTTESQWETQLQGEVGSYSSRTIMTEMGAPTTTGLNYEASSSDNDVCFVRGICAQCRAWGMGFTWFPAHQSGTGNNKRMFYGPGQGAINPSLIIELQYGWDLSAVWSPTWDNPASGSGFSYGFAACSWGSLREDLFGVKSGNIYHTWWFNGSGWNAWEEHACAVAPSGAPGASANNGVANREDIFYIGTDGNLYHQYYNGGWQPSISTWSNIGAPAGVTLVGSPSATSWAANRYDVYARGTDHTVYHAYSSDGTTWNWTDQGGSVTNDVASESWGPNRLDGYALGTGSGAIWHQYWDGSWHPSGTTWAENTPETNAKYAIGASSWGTNRIDLFDNNGSTVGHVWFDSDLSWHGDWTQTFMPPVTPVSAPCATCWGVNRLDVFVLGSDGKCYHLYWGQ